MCLFTVTTFQPFKLLMPPRTRSQQSATGAASTSTQPLLDPDLSSESSDDTTDDTPAPTQRRRSNVGRRGRQQQTTAATSSDDKILKHLDERFVQFSEEIRKDLAKTRDTTVTTTTEVVKSVKTLTQSLMVIQEETQYQRYLVLFRLLLTSFLVFKVIYQ